MKHLTTLLILALLFSSCKNEEKQVAIETKTFNELNQLSWLVGNWSNVTEKEQSYENWTKVNDSTLKAHSFTLVDNDTVFAERVTLFQENNDLFFRVVAYNQNDNEPVIFKMITSKKEVFTFENKNHDFPSRINYSNPVQDSIHAWIEGKVDGEARKVDFYFKRE